MATLDVFYSLACPPEAHRCLEYFRHTTALHKNSAYCHPLFEILDSCNLFSRVSAQSLCRPGPDLPQEVELLRFDFSSKLFAQKPSSEDSADSSSNLWPVVDRPVLHLNLGQDTQSYAELIQAHDVSERYRTAFIWAVRFRRHLMASRDDGNLLPLRIVLSAAAVLLCCHPSVQSLGHIFQDKTELFRCLVLLLRTGPGSNGHDDKIPMEIRLLANQCLSAIVGSRDTSASILSRFSWIQHELGLNRGQYLGLLPCLVRHVIASLVNPESKVASNPLLIQWYESILSLVLAVLSVPAFLTAFIDNGIISLLLTMFKCPRTQVQSINMYLLEALGIQIIDMAVNRCGPMLNLLA